MSKALIDMLRKQRDNDRASADTLLKKVEAGTELSDSEKSNLESLTKSATELDERIKGLTEMELARLNAQALDAKFDKALQEFSVPDTKNDEPQATNLGEMFVKSSQYTNYMKAPAGNSGVFETSEFALLQTAPGIVPTDRVRTPNEPTFQNQLLGVMGYEAVSSNAIDWIEWPPKPPVAGVVAEGAVKPEATYAPTLKTGALEKLAHHIPVTREMLEDVPRVQSIVSGALLQGVRQKAENNAALALMAATVPAVDHETLLKAIRVGIATVNENGYPANTLVINPMDYADIDIEMLDLTLTGARRNSGVWGLTVVPSSQVPAGTAFTGDFRSGMTLYDRRVTNVYITDSHAEEFISNILRILAEARMKAIVTRPEALAKCTVTPAVP